jgi:hypothetical protein
MPVAVLTLTTVSYPAISTSVALFNLTPSQLRRYYTPVAVCTLTLSHVAINTPVAVFTLTPSQLRRY